MLGLLASADGRRVTGLRLRGLDGAVGSEPPADLVVDVSGRGSLPRVAGGTRVPAAPAGERPGSCTLFFRAAARVLDVP